MLKSSHFFALRTRLPRKEECQTHIDFLSHVERSVGDDNFPETTHDARLERDSQDWQRECQCYGPYATSRRACTA